MIDDEKFGLDDEAKRIIQEWELDTADMEFPPVPGQWEERIMEVHPTYRDPSTSLLARCGMPPGLTNVVATRWGGEYHPRFSNFRVEIFGILGQLREGGLADQPPGLFDAPDSLQLISGAYGVFVQNTFDGRIVTLSVHIWRTRLFLRNAYMYVEEIYHAPSDRFLRNVFNMNSGHGPDIQSDIVTLKKLADGLPLLNLVLEEAKPRRGRTFTLEQFKQDAYQAIEILARQSQRKGPKGKRRARRVLSVEPLAAKMGYAKQTVYDVIKEDTGLWKHLSALFEIMKNEPQTTLDDALNRLKPS